MRCRHVVAFAVALATAACSFDFSRADEIAPGTVSGRATLRGAGAPFSRVGIAGSARALRADVRGAFVLRGLDAGPSVLRFSQDEDGDGLPEFAAVRAVRLSFFTRNDGTRELSGVLLGDVPLL